MNSTRDSRTLGAGERSGSFAERSADAAGCFFATNTVLVLSIQESEAHVNSTYGVSSVTLHALLFSSTSPLHAMYMPTARIGLSRE